MKRLIKSPAPGATVGADEIGRFLSPDQRAALVVRLSGDAEARAAALIADARAAAAAILGEAEAQAETVRAAARASGYEAGHVEGHARAMAELEQTAATLRRAADEAEAVRLALLQGVEAQAVALALVAARRVIGAAAETHAGLAAEVVRHGIRNVHGRVLRVRVHPEDERAVSVSLLTGGDDSAVTADTAVGIGGCIIDVEGGTVDLRLATQIESIERVLDGGRGPGAGGQG